MEQIGDNFTGNNFKIVTEIAKILIEQKFSLYDCFELSVMEQSVIIFCGQFA